MMLRLLLFVFVVVHGKTVRYSNVPPRAAITTKTYDLEVPGSAPIRIIEAEPIWSNEEVPSTTPSYLDGLEHRSTKHKTGKEYVTTQPTKTTISEPVTFEPDHPSTEYSPDALNAFLKDYADKVKADRKKYNEDEEENSTEEISDEDKENNKPKSWGLVETKHHNHPYDDKKGWVTLEAVPWSSSKISKWQSHHKNGPKPWENNNKPSSNWNFRPQQDLEYDNSNDDNFNNYNSNNNNPFNSNKNNFNNNNNKHSFNNHDNSFNDYNGNDNSFNYNKNNNKPNFNNHDNSNSFTGYNDNDDNHESNFNNNKNTFGYGNHNNNFNNKFNTNKFNNNNGNNPNDQYNPNDNIFFDKPYAMYDVHIKPSSPFPSKPSVPDQKPLYGYDQRPLQVKPVHSDWPDETPSRPSWNKPPPTIFSNKPIPEPWFDRKPPQQSGYNSNSANSNNDDHRDIITDGRPGDFPSKSVSKPYPTYDSLSNRPVNSVHPSTHPENGNGEWILVSTTKGYQYPRSKHQRSIEVNPNSIGTRRGIRLTVLPPDADSPVNMTTSHGGLLEVESTFQSVEESQKQFSERLKTGNKTRVTNHKNGKKPVRRQVLKIPKPSTQKRPGKTAVVHNKQDATAVLAAVGAGMVPATMAMLVPFVTGRKRRSIDESELTNIVPNITRYSSRKSARM